MNTKTNESDEEDGPSFREMGLDDRLLEAAAVKLAWKEPTDIQKRAIPLIMEGRDLLARGRTGSGKTGAFVIPIIQKVLDCKRIGTGSSEQCVRALIMAPTKELCRQIQNVLKGELCLKILPRLWLKNTPPDSILATDYTYFLILFRSCFKLWKGGEIGRCIGSSLRNRHICS